jgi:hypothetical protein
MPDAPTLRPLAEPLRLAAIEIADLARVADGVQGVIAELSALARPSAELIAEAQAADLLTQRLAGLAAFLRTLSDVAPADAVADVHAAVMHLTLAEQARRLAGPAQRIACEVADELDLFGT